MCYIIQNGNMASLLLTYYCAKALCHYTIILYLYKTFQFKINTASNWCSNVNVRKFNRHITKNPGNGHQLVWFVSFGGVGWCVAFYGLLTDLHRLIELLTGRIADLQTDLPTDLLVD